MKKGELIKWSLWFLVAVTVVLVFSLLVFPHVISVCVAPVLGSFPKFVAEQCEKKYIEHMFDKKGGYYHYALWARKINLELYEMDRVSDVDVIRSSQLAHISIKQFPLPPPSIWVWIWW